MPTAYRDLPPGTINPDDYVFPSKKKLAKLPVLTVRGDPKRFCRWIVDHKEIDKKVPPAFMDFIIETDNYKADYHYTPSMTGFHIRAWENDRVIFTAYLDYNTIDTGELAVSLLPTAYGLSLYPLEGLKILGGETSLNAIGVQAYMLYHKPELVEQIYTPGESHPTRSKKHKVTAQPIRIRKTKIKRITLTDDDTPKKEIHYNKLSWHVRGHYRHVGKDKHLVYIQPSVHTRNGKRYSLKTQTYELTED